MPIQTMTYEAPLGSPTYWQRNDWPDELRRAMNAFLHRHAMTAAQIALVRAYLQYYVEAPCWIVEDKEEQWQRLRERAKTARSAVELRDIINICKALDIDPL